MTRLGELIQAVGRNQEIDESGDATLEQFLEETLVDTNWTVEQFLEQYLVWAAGPNWEQFLKTAKVGDVPPR